MTTAAKRQKLKRYIDDADDKKVKALYALFEENMDSATDPRPIKVTETATSFSDEQIAILTERKASFLKGQNAGADWETMHANIRERRKKAS